MSVCVDDVDPLLVLSLFRLKTVVGGVGWRGDQRIAVERPPFIEPRGVGIAIAHRAADVSRVIAAVNFCYGYGFRRPTNGRKLADWGRVGRPAKNAQLVEAV